MRELGIDISGHRSKSVDEFAEQNFDCVLTVATARKRAVPCSQEKQFRFTEILKILLPWWVRKRHGLTCFVGCAMNSEPICEPSAKKNPTKVDVDL